MGGANDVGPFRILSLEEFRGCRRRAAARSHRVYLAESPFINLAVFESPPWNMIIDARKMEGCLLEKVNRSWRNEREVNLGVRPPRLKVTGDIFVQPFPQREPLALVGFSRVSPRKFADYSCERATYQLVSEWTRWINTGSVYLLVASSFFSRCLFFAFTLLFYVFIFHPAS